MNLNTIKEGDMVKLVRLDPTLSLPAVRYWTPYVGQDATVVEGQGQWADNVLIEFADGETFPAAANEIEEA